MLPTGSAPSARRAATRALGAYASLLAAAHGVFAILQGPGVVPSLPYLAIGPPCRPEAAWHGCLPAMTVVPDVRASGVLAVVAATLLALTVLPRLAHRWAVVGALSLALLLVGGGFVPPLIGLLAAVAAAPLRRTPAGRPPRSWPSTVLGLARTWPWVLIAYLGLAVTQLTLGLAGGQLAPGLASALFISELMLLVVIVAGARARDAVDASRRLGTERGR